MRASIRHVASLGTASARLGSRSAFVCSRCRRRALLQPALPVALSVAPSFQSLFRRSASTKIPAAGPLQEGAGGTTPVEAAAGESVVAVVGSAEDGPRGGGGRPQAAAGSSSSSSSAEVADDGGLAFPSREGYVAAETWDGLERLGGASGWWEAAWDESHQFRGFMPAAKVDEKAVEDAVRTALIDIYTLKEAGRPVSDVHRAPPRSSLDYRRVGLEFAKGSAGPVLGFEHEGDREQILDSMSGNAKQDRAEVGSDEVVSDRENMAAEEEVQPVQASESAAADRPPKNTRTRNWFNIPIDDHGKEHELKFALIKRVAQLTGARVPDPVIRKLYTVGDLVHHLREKPKPKKLAEMLLARSDIMALPNVEIFERRYTPIDREKDVGRWKIIERELEKKGLPVTGH